MCLLAATLLSGFLATSSMLGEGGAVSSAVERGERAESTEDGVVAWTNLVGKVLIAEPVALLPNRESVRFRLARGGTREFPLSTFPEYERTRLAVALGKPPIPPSLIETWDFATEASRRIQALVVAGRATPEDCERRLAALRAMLRNAILSLPDLAPSHRQALLRKIQTL